MGLFSNITTFAGQNYGKLKKDCLNRGENSGFFFNLSLFVCLVVCQCLIGIVFVWYIEK